jgi:hypothetical protein
MMKKPDWKCVFTYVQSFYRRFRNGRNPPTPTRSLTLTPPAPSTFSKSIEVSKPNFLHDLYSIVCFKPRCLYNKVRYKAVYRPFYDSDFSGGWSIRTQIGVATERQVSYLSLTKIYRCSQY